MLLDEVAGYFVAICGLGAAPLWVGLSAGFVLFRVFDIWKPPPIGWLQKLPRGWGIVADDLAAGVVANLLIRLAYALFPALFGLSG